MAQDLYQILGIDRSASEDEIKKAYKKAALKYHPDRQHNKTDEEKKEAEDKFKEISQAYSVLSDPDKKQRYDTFGVIDDSVSGDSGFSSGFNPFEGFGEFFRRAGFGTQFSQRQQTVTPGRDIQMRVSLSIKEIYEGCTKTVKYQRDVRCSTCHGEGGEGKEQCPYCHGTGMKTDVRRTSFGITSNSYPCPHCNRTGYTVKHICNDCSGTGFRREENVVTVNFRAGIENGSGILFKGEGCESESARGVNGDFVAVAQWNFDKEEFGIIGYDVYQRVSIPWSLCLLGGPYDFKLPNDKTVRINIPECSKPDSHLKMKGRGISGQGDYYIIISYDIPNKLSKEERNILKKLQ